MAQENLEALKEEMKAIWGRLVAEIPPRDLMAILFPPWLGYEVLKGTMKGEPIQGGEFAPELPEAGVFGAILDFGRFVGRHYFRAAVEGVEHVPAQGPVVLVGNHNAGLMPLDALFAIAALQDRLGAERIVHPLLHDFAYASSTMGHHARRIGVLRANRENSRAVLDAGRVLLVYPGGDQDAFRPFRERHRIVLAHRRGFVRTALEQRAPVVPLVSVGLHESFFVLSRGRRLAEALDLKKHLRTEVLPVGLSFPWGLGPAFMTFLPLPAKVEMRFGEPILLDGRADDEAAITAGYLRVERAMQAIMDELAADRVPFLGRPGRSGG